MATATTTTNTATTGADARDDEGFFPPPPLVPYPTGPLASAEEYQRRQRASLARIHARRVAAHDRLPPEERDARERAGLVADLAKFAPDPRRRKRLLRKAAEGTLPLGLKRSV